MSDAMPPPPLGGDFALAEVGQISVNVRQLDRAVRFYHDILRLPMLFAGERIAFFAAGKLRLMLALPEQPEFDHPSSTLYFSVSDIRVGYQALVERGVHVPNPPQRVARLETTELWMVFFRDSENNLLALMSEVPLPAK